MSKLIKIDLASKNVLSNVNAIKNEMDLSNDTDRELYQRLSVLEMEFEAAKRDYLTAKAREENA